LTIPEYINLEKLISPYHEYENRVQSCSYDLSLGDEFYVYDNKHGKKVVVDPILDYESICIPENGVCFIITKETLNMPNSLSGQISLSFGLIKKGIMLSNQPPIDPGYKGKIVALFHNLSSEPVYIKKGNHVLTIVFYKVNPTTNYDGDYQNLQSLKRYIKEPVKSSLSQLSDEIKSTKSKNEKFIKFLFTLIPIIVAIVTIVIAIYPFYFNKEIIKAELKEEILKEINNDRNIMINVK